MFLSKVFFSPSFEPDLAWKIDSVETTVVVTRVYDDGT